MHKSLAIFVWAAMGEVLFPSTQQDLMRVVSSRDDCWERIRSVAWYMQLLAQGTHRLLSLPDTDNVAAECGT